MVSLENECIPALHIGTGLDLSGWCRWVLPGNSALVDWSGYGKDRENDPDRAGSSGAGLCAADRHSKEI